SRGEKLVSAIVTVKTVQNGKIIVVASGAAIRATATGSAIDSKNEVRLSLKGNSEQLGEDISLSELLERGNYAAEVNFLFENVSNNYTLFDNSGESMGINDGKINSFNLNRCEKDTKDTVIYIVKNGEEIVFTFTLKVTLETKKD
ncbi:MAG: hypothetical protein ACOCM8_03955, partial [Acetivibrio ethanolgignens]